MTAPVHLGLFDALDSIDFVLRICREHPNINAFAFLLA